MTTRKALLGAIVAFASLALMGGAFAQSDKPKSETKSETKTETAIFASGCFWCTQADFKKLDGVVAAVSGYSGGHKVNPTYREVVAGNTGHLESVEVTYDTSKLTYAQLLDHFWKNVDPFDPIGQFCDKGSSYLGAIFYRNDQEKELAEASKKKVEEKFSKPVVTKVLAAGPFYKAEDYHQDYYKTNATQYNFYRFNCGRDQRLKQLWGDPKAS